MSLIKWEWQWQWSDAWILASMLTSGEKHLFSVRDIIASGDYINHSIFNYDELAHGIAKLESIGFIKQQNDKFLTTDKFVNEFKNVLKNSKNILKLCDKMFEKLSLIELDENLLNKIILMEKSIYENGCKEYLEN